MIIIIAVVVVLLLLLQWCVDAGIDTVIGGSQADLEYPYKRLAMTKTEVHERFNRLRDYKLKLIRMPSATPSATTLFTVRANVPKDRLLYDGEMTLAKVEPDNYDLYDNISDYFQEPQRVLCKRNDQKNTPLEYYSQNYSDSIKLNKLSKSELHVLRDKLYNEHYECTTFKPSLMVGFGKMFKATSILDISAGWGDRLIGALALGVPYVGVDPNSALHPGYKAIVSMFATPHQKKSGDYKVLDDTFQDAELPEREYDLVLSSPPYFNLENYVPADREYGERQSDFQVSSVSEWLDSFLFPSLLKAWNALTCTRDAHMIININEWRDGPEFIESMLKFVDKNCSGSEYLGCIAQAAKTNRPAQPFWIWRKPEKTNSVI